MWLKCSLNYMLFKNLFYEYQIFLKLNAKSFTQNTNKQSMGWAFLREALSFTIREINLIEEIAQGQICSFNDLWKNTQGEYQNGVINEFQGASWQLLGLNTMINILNKPFNS